MQADLLAYGRQVLADQAFSTMIGAQLDRFEPGTAQLSVPMSPSLLQQDGFVHGGVLAYMADRGRFARRSDPQGHGSGAILPATMTEKHLDIPTADGAMNTFVVYPDQGGPHPVVLFYMDAPGKREELHDMARRLAAAGYYVVLPNLYYRRSRDFWLTERTEEKMAVMFEHMNALTNAMTVRDTQAMLRFVDAQPEADASRIGAVGYCMSGPFVMAAAASFPDRIKSIASIHGANLVTDKDDSAHLMAPRIRCESYFACAEIDKWASKEIVDKLESALVAAGTPHRIEWYPGAEHGFVFPKRTGIYEEASAERHWERLFDLFGRTLA